MITRNHIGKKIKSKTVEVTGTLTSFCTYKTYQRVELTYVLLSGELNKEWFDVNEIEFTDKK